MKPKKIFIVRHGESQGNVNKSIYKERPDYALHLTPKGKEQAYNVGLTLKNIIGNEETVKFYLSPFWRTRETFFEIARNFGDSQVPSKIYEDCRLREQEWGQRMDDKSGYNAKLEEYRDNYGHFYYRFEGGESCADVFDRMSDFVGTLHRDFEKKDYEQNVIIVTHGMAMRLFLMRWFHNTVEEFESWRNPKNCGYFYLELQSNNKYKLMTELVTRKVKHRWQFPNYTLFDPTQPK